jgi:glutamate-1-semialdehyde 2,1-aminomutase
MSLQQAKTRELYQRATKVMPYGINSNFRYWGPEDTLVVTHGQGAYIWDADGKRYIDYRMGFGPVILGHAYPAVAERVSQVIREEGNIFAFTTVREIELAERMARLTGFEKVRLANSGTEATMHALRIARAHTGREKFIKFEGQYHGMSDYYLFSTASTPRGSLGSRRSPVNVPVSSGIPKGVAEYVINLPFNDPEVLESTVKSSAGDLAAIVVEPALGNSAGILPEKGFLKLIRELCDRYAIIMLMDEVKTGFRLALGGAKEYFKVDPDMATYAKAMGNGFPIAAIAGKDEVMLTLQPGGVSQGGTYTGNFVGVAAAAATLEILESEPVLATIAQRGKMLMSGLGEVLSDAGIPHQLLGHPSMFGIALGASEPPVDFRGYSETDVDLYERIMVELGKLGALPELDGREPWFLSYSHSERDIADTLEWFEQAVKTARS